MNYQVDVAEIVRFIECGIDASSSKDATECVARFTEAAKDKMLNELSEKHNETRSNIMRKALKDFYKFNTEKEI